MKKGIIGTPFVAYEVAAAIHDDSAPASVMPSWRICPFLSSR